MYSKVRLMRSKSRLRSKVRFRSKTRLNSRVRFRSKRRLMTKVIQSKFEG